MAPGAGDDHDGLHRVLGARQIGDGGELIGDRDHGRAHLAPVVVGPAAPVLDRLQSGDADRDVALADPPGAAERVGDHDSGGDSGQLSEAVSQDLCRLVGVDREHHDRVLARDVGRVDAGVGADEAVVGLADQDAADRADQLLRLVEHDLDVARVLVVLGGELVRELARMHVVQVPDASLDLRHGLVGDHDDIPVVQRPRRLAGCERRLDQRREVVVGLQLREAGDGAGGDHRWLRSSWLSIPRVCAAPPCLSASASRKASRSSGVSTSSASVGTLTIWNGVPASRASWA